MQDKYWLLTLEAPVEIKDRLEIFLWEYISCGWEECGNLYKIYFSTQVELDEFLKKIKKLFPYVTYTKDHIKSGNWADGWKRFFTPVKLNRFIILPSWEQKDFLTKDDLLPIFIYPEMAFGTGHHETTKLCLKQIERLYQLSEIKVGDTFLDIGTGSGILGISLSKLGLTGIGLDIDPLILTNCKTNIQLNNVNNFSFFIGTTQAIGNSTQYNLIIANILLEPLINLKSEIFRLLKKDGFLICSGILIDQETKIISSYTDLFNDPVVILREGEWSSILWKRS